MLFLSEHIEMIKNGTKTVTRRRWKRWAVKVGGVYACQTKMFQKKEDCEVFIRVTDRYYQPLRHMRPWDAHLEGGYSLEEFKELWEEITGEPWNPKDRVHVIEFEYVADQEAVHD